MRRDFDYVTMADYQADMRESTDNAVANISYWKKRAEQAELMCCLAVLAAGGKVEIPSEWLLDPKLEITHMRNDANMSRVIMVRRS